jgi:RNA-directed DNA polymerase
MDAITGIQASLARKAKEEPNHRFGDLWPLICREEWIGYAFEQVLTNTGSKTAGIDGVTRKHFEEEEAKHDFVLELQAELKAKTFKPSPARRVYIPKANGKLRPLGIPTMKDRTIQMLLKMVMEPIWESDFLDCAHGFRIGRRTMDCIWWVYQLTYPRSKMYWAIEGDIQGCFDNIHHAKLMSQLEKRLGDARVLRLLDQFLTAGVMEGQLFKRAETGTPQGGIVSPLLANIYLHQLDCYWWNKHGNLKWKDRWGRRLNQQGNNHLIRYADDFLILTNGTRSEAERLKEEFGEFLRSALKLELSPDKTLITHVNDGYNFLGFNIRRYVKPKEGTKPVVLVKPSDKGVTNFKNKVRQLTATNRLANPLDTLKAYNRLAAGWSNYYRFVNSKDIFTELDHWAFKRLLFWFARHHGIGPMRAWEQYVKLQPGRQPGTMRKNLAVTDDKGHLLFCQKMGDLEVRRYVRRKQGNPYLTGSNGASATGVTTTTLNMTDAPLLDNSWTGRTTPDHAQWRAERLNKLTQVGYRCERCGSQINLDVHHRKPAKGRDRTTLHHQAEWLEALCEKCHLELHKPL